MGRGRKGEREGEREGERKNFGFSSSYKGMDPIMGAPTSLPHLNLINPKSPISKYHPLHGEFTLPPMNLGEHRPSVQSSHPVSSGEPDGSHLEKEENRQSRSGASVCEAEGKVGRAEVDEDIPWDSLPGAPSQLMAAFSQPPH